MVDQSGGSSANSFGISAQVTVAGQRHSLNATGTGPIDAFVEGLNASTGHSVRVLGYHEHSIGSGADAQAVAYLELRINEQTLFGVGIDSSIVSASLKAIMSGLQRSAAGQAAAVIELTP